jgi:hypothetical protein
VLAEISEKVQADMEAREEAEAEVSEPDAVVEAPPAAEPAPQQSEAIQAKTEETPASDPVPALSETASVETGEPPAASPVAPQQEASEDKTESAAPPETPVNEKEPTALIQEVKPEELTGEPEENEKPDKEDIERLNQKIMEQAKSVQTNADTKVTEPAESEIPETQVADEGNGARTSAPPEVAAADNSNASVAAPPQDSDKVAALPPGGAQDAPKEEQAPVDDVKSWCQERYQTPSELESCMKQRAVAKDRIDKLSGKFSNGSKERGVLEKCMSDWKEGSTYNYEMVIYCTQFYCTQSNIDSCKDLSR